MGDRICVMKDGIVQQFDTPQNLYNYPCNVFVAGFIGSPQMNFLTVKVEKSGSGCVLVFGDTRMPVSQPELQGYVGKEVIMGIRPEHILADEDSLTKSPQAVFTAKVSLTEMMGSEIYLYMESNGQKMLARVPSHFHFHTEETVRLAIDMSKIHIFDKETQKIICRA